MNDEERSCEIRRYARRARHTVRRRAGASRGISTRSDYRCGRNGTWPPYRFHDGSIMNHLSGMSHIRQRNDPKNRVREGALKRGRRSTLDWH